MDAGDRERTVGGSELRRQTDDGKRKGQRRKGKKASHGGPVYERGDYSRRLLPLKAAVCHFRTESRRRNHLSAASCAGGPALLNEAVTKLCRAL